MFKIIKYFHETVQVLKFKFECEVNINEQYKSCNKH